MKKILGMLALLAVLAAPVSAQQGRHFDFRGHHLGDEKWNESLECSVIEGPTTDRQCQDRTRIGVADATVTYWFFATKLGRVSFSYDPKDFDEIVLLFKGKFGTPTITSSTVGNAMGAKLINHVATWRTQDGTLTLMKYGNTITEGIGGITASWAAKLEDERKAEERKRNGV